MKKIAICGSYGTGNTGDELLLSVIMSGMEKVIGEKCEFTVVTTLPESTAKNHGVPCFYGGSWRKEGSGYVAPDPPQETVEVLKTSDLFIVGGGGLVGHDHTFAEKEARVAHDAGTPCMLFGVGSNHNSENMAGKLKEYFSCFDRITTRDGFSENWVHFSGGMAQRTADPAFTIGELAPSKKEKSIGILLQQPNWFNWYDDGHGAKQSSINRVASSVKELADEHGYSVELIPFFWRNWVNDRDQDNVMASRLAQATGSDVVCTDGWKYEDFYERIGKQSFIIGDRYHALIIAALSGVPFMGIMGIHSKIRELSGMLGQEWLGYWDILRYFRTKLETSLAEIETQRSRLLNRRKFPMQDSWESFRIAKSIMK